MKKVGIIINIVYFLITETYANNSCQLERFDYSLLAKKIVKIFCLKKYNLCKNDINFEKNENGKPYIRGFENFHFNISHTSGALAVAFSEREIGVDIEKLRIPNFKVAQRFFTNDENEYLSIDSEDMNKRFFEIWTKKEAALKRQGLKLKDIKHINTFETKSYILSDFVLSVCAENIEDTVLIPLENLEGI